jgi:hypothetical protein
MAVTFTDIIPVTEQNQLFYEIAVKISLDSKLGTRQQAIKRSKRLKQYAQERYSQSYKASDCYRLFQLEPNSQRYYQSLRDLLNWERAGMVEDYWAWYKKQFSFGSVLLKPFEPAMAGLLNSLIDIDCTVEEWNEALKLVLAIDLYRLAGETILMTFEGDRTVKLEGFEDA